MELQKLITSSLWRVIIGSALLLVFASTLFFGFVHIANMQTMTGESGCPFSLSGGSVCPTEVGDHLSLWKDLTLAAPIVLFLLLLLVPLVRTVITACSQFFKQFLQVWELTPYILSIRQVAYIPIPSYLEESFSKGILHPKRF